jgi:hypothetical protein
VVDADPVDHLQSVLARPEYRPGLTALVLCEDVQLRGFSTRSVGRLVKFTQEVDSQLENARVAIVTTQRPVYGLLRMFQLIRRPSFELALFKEAQTARRWLASPRKGRDSA